MTNSLLLNMAMEIVSFPIKDCDFQHVIFVYQKVWLTLQCTFKYSEWVYKTNYPVVLRELKNYEFPYALLNGELRSYERTFPTIRSFMTAKLVEWCLLLLSWLRTPLFYGCILLQIIPGSPAALYWTGSWSSEMGNSNIDEQDNGAVHGFNKMFNSFLTC